MAELLALELGAEEGLRNLRLGYTESRGAPTLRQAVADTYARVEADEVLVHNAAVEVFLTVALAVLEPGDHAVVHHPGYQAQLTTVEIAGATVSRWWARPEAGWAPDLGELEDLLDRPRTRLLVVTSPHNPTGFHFDESVLRAILAMAEERGVITLVDEAYRGTEYEPDRRLPSAADISESAAALGVMSKGLGLPGLRLGSQRVPGDAGASPCRGDPGGYARSAAHEPGSPTVGPGAPGGSIRLGPAPGRPHHLSHAPPGGPGRVRPAAARGGGGVGGPGLGLRSGLSPDPVGIRAGRVPPRSGEVRGVARMNVAPPRSHSSTRAWKMARSCSTAACLVPGFREFLASEAGGRERPQK